VFKDLSTTVTILSLYNLKEKLQKQPEKVQDREEAIWMQKSYKY